MILTGMEPMIQSMIAPLRPETVPLIEPAAQTEMGMEPVISMTLGSCRRAAIKRMPIIHPMMILSWSASMKMLRNMQPLRIQEEVVVAVPKFEFGILHPETI